MITVQTKVIGTAEVKARFLRVGDSIRERIKKALLALAEQVRDEAASAAPHKTGALANSIRVKLTEKDTKLTVRVGPSKFYGRFLEFGVVSGKAPARPSGLRGFFTHKETGRQASRRIAHMKAAGQYRITPRPFMSPAIERVRARVDDALQAALAAALSTEN